ncbi:MAG: glycosyltransferase [Lachnospiraceae bacterium]|nr:glycosyltransferase [Lachnospiraceae bacterium]
MNILYIDYQMYGKEDMIEAFMGLGHNVYSTDVPVLYEDDRDKLTELLYEDMSGSGCEIAFTSNYHPEVSELAEKLGMKYISWTYDSPLITLYHPSILNECNYVFIFDSEEVRQLKARGVKHVYYMPLGINPERIDAITISKEDEDTFSSDVSLVASLYNEEHNLYDRMSDRLDEHTRGYLEGVMNAQANMYGANIIDEVLSQNAEIVAKMYKAMPYTLDKGSLAGLPYVYANYFLCRKVANIQRIQFIKEISKRFDMKVYTPGDVSDIETVKAMGTVDYKTDMNKVFMLSKINLNITLPSIHTGIPLRAMDIMGAGGFLLSNWQRDFDGLFENGTDYSAYTGLDEALYLIDYYLSHNDERCAIADTAKQKMRDGFDVIMHIHQMMEIVEDKGDKV